MNSKLYSVYNVSNMSTKTITKVHLSSKTELLQKAKQLQKTDPDRAEALRDIAYGRTVSQEELFARLGL